MMVLARVFITLLTLIIALAGFASVAPGGGGGILISTTSVEAHDMFVQARLLAEKFKFADARALYQQALAKDPNFALAWRGLAQAEPDAKSYQNDMDKAVALVDKVSDCEKFLILADNAGGKRNLTEQRNFLAQLAAKCPDDEHTQMAFGLYYFGSQYYDSAAVALQKAVDLAPNFVAAWNMLGYAHRNGGDYAGAEKAFQKYIEVSPTDANAYDSYAELLLKEGKYEQAVTQYRKALAVDTTFVLSYFNMAAPLMYLGRYDEARSELNKLLQKAVDDGQRITAHFGTAVTYADEGKLSDAIAALEKSNALSAKANDVAAMAGNEITIGILLVEQGKFDEAMKSGQKAAEMVSASNLSPAIKAALSRNTLYIGANIAALKGEMPKAQALADSFSAKCLAGGTANDMASLHELSGTIALAAKQYTKAIDHLKQAPAFNGYDIYRLALAYKGAGDDKNALAQMTLAATINSVPTLNDVLKRREALRLVKEWSGK
jgi:tetratricopeptide (TPR) repeat protein